MDKTLIASAVALSLGTAGNTYGLTMNMTQMRFNGTFNASGTLNSSGNGYFTSLTAFFGQHWTAHGLAFFSATGANTWANTHGQGAFSYNFSLTANQVAWGLAFDWNLSNYIPVLNIMTCTGFSTGSTCTGIGTPMQTPPFPGQAPAFDGTVANSSAIVPVPAAAWLMGSALVGLAGLSRRK
jgi:hypothetical protein